AGRPAPARRHRPGRRAGPGPGLELAVQRGAGMPGWRRAEGGLNAAEHLERRVPGRDGADLIVARVRPGALEEDPDLGFPSLEVGAQDGYLLVVGELPAAEGFGVLAHPQLTGSGDPQVAHPLGFAARRDEITVPVVVEQIHRRGTPLAARPALHSQDARTEDADALPGQERHQPVEHVAGEPTGRTVIVGHAVHPLSAVARG